MAKRDSGRPLSERPSTKRHYVRELARQVAEIAGSDENRRVVQRWRDVNALRRADRAPVWCRPVGAWEELLPQESLRCHQPWLGAVEYGLRRILIKHEIGDDSPVDPFYAVPTMLRWDPPNIWGLDISHRTPDDPRGAWGFDPPLKTEADYDRLRPPSVSVDHARTQEALERAHELLGDILPVRQVCAAPLDATLGTTAAELRGLSEMMLDMALRPELMHRLMAHLRDGVLGAMRTVQSWGLLTPNNNGPMICSDPLGPTPNSGRLSYGNLWVMANSQEFDAVSPSMWSEFCLAYQRPIIEQFGLSAYGCCENLTHKIDGVLSLRNLRIFVSSAWTDLDRVIERVGNNHVIMWRQKASDVVFADDADALRRDLRDGMRRLRGCHVQIVLRELQTLAGHSDRLHVWTRLAKEAAAQC